MQTTNPTCPREPVAIAHEKGGETFVFVVTESNAPAMLSHLATLASDPAHPLCWIDEQTIAATIRERFTPTPNRATDAR